MMTLIQIVQTIVLAFIALMGLWLRAEFFKFKDETVQPLIDRMNTQFNEHAMRLAEVRQITQGLSASIIDMRAVSSQMSMTISEMDHGINERTLELGRHDERLKWLSHRLERLEEHARTRRAIDHGDS